MNAAAMRMGAGRACGDVLLFVIFDGMRPPRRAGCAHRRKGFHADPDKTARLGRTDDQIRLRPRSRPFRNLL